MKKNYLMKKAILLLLPFAAISSGTLAQSQEKATKKTPVQTASERETELKAKHEANGYAYMPNKAAKQTNASRPCVKNTSAAPVKLNKATFNRLSVRGKTFVKNHPEKFTIVN